MTDRPKLQEIANMPYSKTRNAIRAHYDPMFGKASADDKGGKNCYSVTVEYTTTDEEIYEIRANVAQAPREIAEEIFEDSHGAGYEISDITVYQINAN